MQEAIFLSMMSFLVFLLTECNELFQTFPDNCNGEINLRSSDMSYRFSIQIYGISSEFDMLWNSSIVCYQTHILMESYL